MACFIPARAPAPNVPIIFANRIAGGSSEPEPGVVDIAVGKVLV